VIPDGQPVGPPATIPSTPQRVLPPTGDLPLGARFQLEPSIELREEYTDNFDLTEDNRRSNFRSTVSPGLRIGINSPLTTGLIDFTFAPSYDTVTDDVAYFYSLLAQVVWQANPRWQLTVADTFTHSDEPSQADRLGLRTQRDTFTANTLSLTSDYLIGTVATRGFYRWGTFSDDTGEDTTSHLLGANATIPLYRINSVFAGYEYLTAKTEGGTDTPGQQAGARGDQFDVNGHEVNVAVSRQSTTLRTVGVKGSYAFRTVTDDIGDAHYQIWTAAVFTKYALPGRLTLEGSLGATGLTSDIGASVGPKLFSATRISYEFGRAIATLAFDSGLSETFSGGENFGVVETQGITGSLLYPFTPKLSGTVSGSYRKNKSANLGDEPGQVDKNKNWGGTLALLWRIQRRLLLSVSYTYREQVGSDDGVSDALSNSSYTENRVQASLRISF
jgi:hypothetical protein